jgi:class 3 adenylate cyclase/tetratricopeptide (TPR) repeat protein
MATVCPRCGEPNPGGFRFCGSCGAALADTERRDVRKVVTVLFADVVGSTALGEQRDPEAVRALMSEYFESARSVIERHGGTVEKFIGDAVMAVFGVPQAHEDDALRAVRAADELRESLAAGDVQVRVGVNTGEVVAGEGGTLITGDAVNVAARLEQAAAPGEVLLGTETLRLVRDAVRVEPRSLAVKGKEHPVEAARLVAVDRSAPAFARRLDSPLVGRRRELGRLRNDFEQAAADSACHLFTLLGPAGVGKSRLVAEFVAEIGDRARVLRGRCLHYGEGITYWPLVEILLKLGVDPEAILNLPAPIEAAVATRKLFEVEAARQPLVLVFDDLQWAEPTFLDLIEHVVDWSRDAPIFLLGVARPELLEVRPAWGGGKPNATTVLLEALRADETETLIANLRGSEELAEETRRRIVRASEGNPLFVEEMLLMLGEAGGDGNGDVQVPPTIRALLQARLDRLATEERAVVERGAVEGEVFHRAPVAELAPPPVRNGLDGHLLQLVRKEVIRPESATMPGDDAFRFRHLLIRDAAYEALPKETRADLHERFAEWLDAHVELVEQDEIVGYHLEQSALYRAELGREDERLAVRAAERLTAAGIAAVGRGDRRAGAGLLQRAVRLLPRGHEARLEALPQLAWTLTEAGRFEEGRAFIEELDGAGDARWTAYALVIGPFHDALSGSGSVYAGRPGIAAARKTFEELGDDIGLGRALFMEGGAEWTALRAGSAIEFLRAALASAERAGDSALLQDIRGYLISAYAVGPLPVREAEREVRGIVGKSPGLLVEAYADRSLGFLAGLRGDFAAARDLIGRGCRSLEDAGLLVLHAASSQRAALVEEAAGERDRAIALLREGFDALTGLDEHAYASTNAAMIAWLAAQSGRDEEAERWVATARELSPEADVATLLTADCADAVLRARRGEHDRAERLARRAVEATEAIDFFEQRMRAHTALALVLSEAGRRDEAREAVEAVIAICEEKGSVASVERARELLAQL